MNWSASALVWALGLSAGMVAAQEQAIASSPPSAVERLVYGEAEYRWERKRNERGVPVHLRDRGAALGI